MSVIGLAVFMRVFATTLLALAVSVPYSRGSTVNEYHFFSFYNFPIETKSTDEQALRISRMDHFHVFKHFSASKKTICINPPLKQANIPFDIWHQSLTDDWYVFSLATNYFTGVSPPESSSDTASGLSPPVSYFSCYSGGWQA